MATKATKESAAPQDVEAVELHQPGSLPMFYTKPIWINTERHGNAALMPMTQCKFATPTNSIPVNVTEFTEAAKSYPIVFTTDAIPAPAVIVGLEKSNYFVDASGQWKADNYVPAYVRRYPFIFMHMPQQDQFVLCVDEASDQFCETKKEGASPFYDAVDQPSELTKSALEFCKTYQQHHVITQQFSQVLKDLDLLVANTSTLTLFNGRVVTLSDFQMIDEKKFNALPDKDIVELHKKGWLPFIYFALMSASNWKRLADMASLTESGGKKAK